MSVSIVVPYRPDGGERDKNWEFLHGVWSRWFPNWQLVLGDCPGDAWIKADAVSAALAQARGDIIVMADADVWCEGVAEAVAQVEDDLATWAVPHFAVHRMTPKATAAVLRRDPIHFDLEEPPYKGIAGGGLFVMRREAYEAAPLDRRFRGWGQEDASAELAWTTLYGQPWRGMEPLWHFWHPPMKRDTRAVGSKESRALWERYRSANHNRLRMRALVAEGVEES